MSQPLLYPPCPAIFTAAHRQRCAVIYVRQSSPFQVSHNTGSTARQYSLRDLAVAWGWPPDRIITIDDDLGSSSATIGTRTGFPQLLALISAGRVSAVFIVHADRIARNFVEFSQFVAACEQFQVSLVINGELKDLRAPDDRFVTVLLGVFAERENRDRTQKLRGSLLAKIQVHHEALGTPPAGYEAPVDSTAPAQRHRTWGARWEKSSDPAVIRAIEAVFALFREYGTVGAVVRQLRRQEWQLPCRVMGGSRYGTVVFQPVTHARVRSILKNPGYTDAFVRQRTYRRSPVGVRADGTMAPASLQRPLEEWVMVRDHHESYLPWDEYLRNQERMRANTKTRLAVPRNGPALLGRLLTCGHCGYAMVVQYGRSGQSIAHGRYECHREGTPYSPLCHAVSASYIDPPVIRAVLQTLANLTPQTLAEALAHEQDAHVRDQQQRTHTLREAEAAVALAARRYETVDLEHALVRQQLEHEYEAALRRRTECELTLARTPSPALPAIGSGDAQALQQVAADVGRVWDHPAITNEERKEILRALLGRILCTELSPGVVDLTLQWHGGGVSTVRTYRPSASKRLILEYWHAGATADEIAARLTAAGLCTTQHQAWGAKTVENVLYKHARPTERWRQTQQGLQALAREGLRGHALAQRLNTAGLRTIANNPWTPGTVGTELGVMSRSVTGATNSVSELPHALGGETLASSWVLSRNGTENPVKHRAPRVGKSWTDGH
jgi:DNA invertase Pin-like site-specific DNA recombinase